MRLLGALLLVTTMAFAGCGGGGGGGAASATAASCDGAIASTGASSGSVPGGSTGAPGDVFTLSSTSVTFNATQGAPEFFDYKRDPINPAPAIINVATTSGNVFVNTLQTGTMFSHWFTADSSRTGHITIAPAHPSEAGSFAGTIIVNGCSNATGPCNHLSGSPKMINVIYDVTGLSITPAQLTFSSTDTDRAPRTVALGVTGSGCAVWDTSISPLSATDWLFMRPWTATIDASTPRQTVSINVSTAGLRPGVYGATLTFSARPSLRTSMTVTLTVADPSVNFVAPYVVPAGVGGEVIIRGRGFSALSPGSLSVQFNSTPATAVVVNDTEIQASYPPLDAGTYSISLNSGDMSMPSRAALKLLVINPPAFALTTIQRPASAGRPANLIYDPERQALLFVDPANNRILRYALAGSGSTSSENADGRIALSPDGTELIKTGPGMRFSRLDPVTLAVLSSVDASASVGFGLLYRIAFANDGVAIANGYAANSIVVRYDMLTQAVTPLSSQLHTYDREIFASTDGGTLVLPFRGAYQTDKRVYTYDARTGALTPRPPTTSATNWLSMSRNASRMILVNDSSPTPITVYDPEFNVRGTLPNGASTFVLSPDGNVAYGYYPQEGRVRKFNLSAPGGVTEVGAGSAVAAANTDMSEMTISPDGGTLFLAGRTRVVIAPAP